MKISIVTISYNQGAYIEETINSVLNQRGVDFEYIIVDPGSADNSRSIINQYSSRCKHIVFEPDSGPGDGLNKGFNLASGDIYGYLNSDDILLPATLKKVQTFFENNPDVDVVSAHGNVIDANSMTRHKIFSYHIKDNNFVRKRFSMGLSVLVQQSTFIRASAFKKSGGFDTRFRSMWDGALVIDLLNAGCKFSVVNDTWSSFRLYPESISGASNGQFGNSRAQEELKLLQEKAKVTVHPKEYFFYNYVGRLIEWKITLLRIIDGINNRNRLI